MTNLLSIRAVCLLVCLMITPFAAHIAFAQDPEPGTTISPPLDDITERSVVSERQILKEQPIREADIFWEKRIWRIIDTREKMNLPFVAPEAPLFNILAEAAQRGDLAVYSTEDDHFTKRLKPEDVGEMLSKRDTISRIDPVTYEETTQVVSNQVNWENVKRYRLKESWFFDARTGSLRVRILGIAPMIDVLDEEGNFKFEKPLFWVYYPAARPLLARHKVVTPGGNYATTLSWEDWLEMRHFASSVTKENNVQDLRLQDMYSGVDLLTKSAQIQDAIINKEQDAWSW